MKELIAALCILGIINVASLQAEPIEKKQKFSNSELLALSEQQIASFEEIKEIEAVCGDD